MQFDLSAQTSISPLFTWKLPENYPSQYPSVKEHTHPGAESLQLSIDKNIYTSIPAGLVSSHGISKTIVITPMETLCFPSFPLFFKPVSSGDL